jgi:hypothetical protein
MPLPPSRIRTIYTNQLLNPTRGFEPGGASRKAVAGKERSYRDILRAQPPSVRYLSFSFESLGGLHPDAVGLLGRLQGGVNLSLLTHDDCVWFSVIRRVSFAIAKAVGRQLSSWLPWWGASSGGVDAYRSRVKGLGCRVLGVQGCL